jgi:hypothetical protein
VQQAELVDRAAQVEAVDAEPPSSRASRVAKVLFLWLGRAEDMKKGNLLS